AARWKSSTREACSSRCMGDSMAFIDELQSLVKHPSSPKAAEGDWMWLEGELGLHLPNDYKAYIQAYGSGTLCNYFYIPSPFESLDPPKRYWANWASFYNDMAELGEPVPHPVFPAVPGLLPCGTYGDVDILNWLTTGDPENWRFIYLIARRDSSTWETSGC